MSVVMVKVVSAGEAVWGKTNIALLWLNSDSFCPAVAADVFIHSSIRSLLVDVFKFSSRLIESISF